VLTCYRSTIKSHLELGDERTKLIVSNTSSWEIVPWDDDDEMNAAEMEPPVTPIKQYTLLDYSPPVAKKRKEKRKRKNDADVEAQGEGEVKEGENDIKEKPKKAKRAGGKGKKKKKQKDDDDDDKENVAPPTTTTK
jgi:hypothetical protein